MEANIESFFSQRSKIVSAINRYQTCVTDRDGLPFSEISELLETEKAMITALLVRHDPSRSAKRAQCTEARIGEIIECIDVLELMLEADLARQAHDGLLLICAQIGGLRLAGIEDTYADVMDRYIFNLDELYNGKHSPMPLGFHELQTIWRSANYVDPGCPCPHCSKFGN
ncbi:hypothetical protein N7495_002088 [Penicillium taxi]|uniref:uncharacterized protein n=1 Tax=Penicillium taxi TaxID=168475 RepID=UPI002545A23F|nr:uncharacterized protein N7495_002088 [Penicillium taxi]KAJ5901560.1 hypothetical protein N7495_002088 [Penicillium taxi]